MKLYMHPVSNTSRPVRLFIAENKLDVEEQVVDLFTGEHYKEPYIKKNPNHMVPMLEDGDFTLTECSAILKYLASKFDLPDYPKELKERAKVDEAMDWFNTQFYRDYAYGLAYPQMYPHHKRPGDEVQNGTVKWGQEKAREWFQLLNDHWLAGGKDYIANDKLSIADYLGGCFCTLGEVIRCDFAQYPNVARWVGNIKKMASWNSINEAHYGFANAVKDQPFQAL